MKDDKKGEELQSKPTDQNEDEPLKKTQKETRMALSRSFRILLFFVLVSVELAINNSSGLLSSASTNIKATLEMNDADFGMFGTANGLGRVIGSSIFIIIVNTFNRKWVFAFFVIVKSFLLVLFKLTTKKYLLIGTRFLIGIVHMPPSIYIPVWIDQFGVQSLKTMFMTIVQVVMPTGKVVGYLLHAFFGPTEWQMGFVFEGCYLFLVGLFVSFTPEKYFSQKLIVVKDEDGEHVEKKKKDKISVFELRKSINNNEKQKQSSSFLSDLVIVVKNLVLINGIFVRAILFGVNTALHFWISDYIRTVFLINDTYKVLVSYFIIAVSGPLGGVLASSFVSCFLGGYENKHSALVLLVLHIIACGFGLFIPFTPNIIWFCIITALYFVFNSAALPIVQGLIITSVEPKLKGTAFSVANLVTMLLTSGPAPYLYGVVNDKFKKQFKGVGMLAIMLVGCVGILFIITLNFFRYRRFAREEKENKLIEKKKKEASNDIATDIAGAVNEASIEMNCSLDKSREGIDVDDEEGDVEMKTKS